MSSPSLMLTDHQDGFAVGKNSGQLSHRVSAIEWTDPLLGKHLALPGRKFRLGEPIDHHVNRSKEMAQSTRRGSDVPAISCGQNTSAARVFQRSQTVLVFDVDKSAPAFMTQSFWNEQRFGPESGHVFIHARGHFRDVARVRSIGERGGEVGFGLLTAGRVHFIDATGQTPGDGRARSDSEPPQRRCDQPSYIVVSNSFKLHSWLLIRAAPVATYCV